MSYRKYLEEFNKLTKEQQIAFRKITVNKIMEDIKLIKNKVKYADWYMNFISKIIK